MTTRGARNLERRRRHHSIVRSAAELTQPNQIPALVAHWSGNGSTATTLPQRITSAGVGDFTQSNASKRGKIGTLSNGVKYIELHGVTSVHEMTVAVVSALNGTGKRYWAMHVQRLYSAANRVVYAEGTSTTRIAFTFNGATFKVSVGDATNPSNSYTISRATQQAGAFVEVVYDPTQSTAADRIRVFVARVELSRSATAGTMPTSLPASAAANFTLGSEAGANNGLVALAHLYIGNDIPTTLERDFLSTFELPTWDNPFANVGAFWNTQEATLVGSDISSVPEVLGGNALTAGSPARRPANGASASGVAMATYDVAGDVIKTPQNVAALNDSINQLWYCWIRCTSIPGTTQEILSISNGFQAANLRRLNFELATAMNLRARVHLNQTQARQATTTVTLDLDVWHLVGIEYNGNQTGEENRCVLTLDAVVQASTFADSGTAGAGAMPATLVTTVGSALVGGFSDSDTAVNPFNGDMGAPLLAGNIASAGVTAGLLTQAQRNRLLTFMPPE